MNARPALGRFGLESSTLRLPRILLAASIGLLGLLEPMVAGRADGPADNRPEQVRPIPPLGEPVAAEIVDTLQWRCGAIRTQWRALMQQARGVRNPTPSQRQRTAELESYAAEILVFPRAVELAIECGQFYRPADPEVASRLLDEAARRIAVAEQGGSWTQIVGLGDGSQRQLIVGGFASRIDGSFQPYGLVVPRGLSADDRRPRRLDLWFHGRGEKLSEVAFLDKQLRDPGPYTPEDTFVLHPYGRYSNAFKFAGEIDVLEALDHVRGQLPVDDGRVSVRGFSMGGAACWQFATHYPDRWFAANPGAGFSETAEFLKFFQDEDVRATAPAFQQKLWQLYDCPVWAGNLAHCPTVAYSGEVDRQKQAADVMQAALRDRGIDLVHIIGPDTAHKIHPASAREIESRMAALAARADRQTPRQIDFTTVTLRYHRLHWVDLRGLAEHWTAAHVNASIEGPSSIHVRTQNVTRLRLDFGTGDWPGSTSGPITVEVDGQSIAGTRVRSDRSWTIELSRQGGHWSIAAEGDGLRKRPGLQGPIDDAFLDSFLFVLPSESGNDPAVDAWVDAESAHAMRHWRTHFRGDVRKVLDRDLTDAQIAAHHLVLFGDAGSNRVIREIQGDLPLQWDGEAIAIGDAKVPASGHIPILIHPNPLNPDRYVVLNSGFTFREYDYLNNARQTPKLPDWALVDIRQGATSQSPGIVRAAGFFGENWSP